MKGFEHVTHIPFFSPFTIRPTLYLYDNYNRGEDQNALIIFKLIRKY